MACWQSFNPTERDLQAREVLLPAAVDAASMQKTFRNGILELKLKKASE